MEANWIQIQTLLSHILWIVIQILIQIDSGPGAPVKCLFTSSRYKPYTQVVFLDDIGANLKSARKLGMSTIKVTEVGQAVRELEQILDTKLSLNSKL